MIPLGVVESLADTHGNQTLRIRCRGLVPTVESAHYQAGINGTVAGEEQAVVLSIVLTDEQRKTLIEWLRRDRVQVYLVLSDMEGYIPGQEAASPSKTGIPREKLLLTVREAEVMGLLSRGMMSKQIADRLGINLQTVKNHLKKIYRKLNVGNRSEAIVKYLMDT
jgi:DNA-binding CsgD family transcriptional regulator